MKNVILFTTLLFSLAGLSEELKCDYLNHDNTKGQVELKIKNAKVVLEFKSLTISADGCGVQITPLEINVECNDQGNAIGVVFELIDGKFEGILMSEKAQVFAQANCH